MKSIRVHIWGRLSFFYLRMVKLKNVIIVIKSFMWYTKTNTYKAEIYGKESFIQRIPA